MVDTFPFPFQTTPVVASNSSQYFLSPEAAVYPYDLSIDVTRLVAQ